ncbi:MAG TPA: hypothetical protein VLB84_16595 [Bacteroidia bacterium]|nr:hypothetical protein [Bacteroidia bacterium]
MEDTTNNKPNQEKKRYGTHIRVSDYLKIRLSKISKDTGKKLTNVANEIIKRGIEDYYKGTDQ